MGWVLSAIKLSFFFSIRRKLDKWTVSNNNKKVIYKLKKPEKKGPTKDLEKNDQTTIMPAW